MNLRHLLTHTHAYMPPAGILADLSEEQAFARLPNAPHNIAELLAHMDFWQTWFLSRCRGEEVPMAETAARGWPQVSPGSWNALRDSFLTDLEAAATLGDDPDALAKPVTPPIAFPPFGEFTIREALTHAALHNAHHLGQIVTLRQLMGIWPPPSGSWTW